MTGEEAYWAGLGPADEDPPSVNVYISTLERERDNYKEAVERGVKVRLRLEERAGALERTLSNVHTKLLEIEQHCPCGARTEALDTHPHSSGCLVETALSEARKALEAK